LLRLLLLLPLLLVSALIELMLRASELFLSERRAGGVQVTSGVRTPVFVEVGQVYYMSKREGAAQRRHMSSRHEKWQEGGWWLNAVEGQQSG
jgi:hypothetical protein